MTNSAEGLGALTPNSAATGSGAERDAIHDAPAPSASPHKSRPPLCPCARTCTPIYNALGHDDRLITGDLNEGYSGDCIGQSVPLEYTIGGQKHVNDMNHCMFTPLKGVVRMMINKDDLSFMLHMIQQTIAELAPRVCGQCSGRRNSANWHFFITDDHRTLCCDCYHKQNDVFADAE
jgi:hypothetical protein